MTKYSDTDTPPEERNNVEKALYSMIRLLLLERRISEETFRLEPVKDREMIRLDAEIRQISLSLEKQSQLIDILSKRMDKTNKLLTEFLEKWQTKGIPP